MNTEKALKFWRKALKSIWKQTVFGGSDFGERNCIKCGALFIEPFSPECQIRCEKCIKKNRSTKPFQGVIHR